MNLMSEKYPLLKIDLDAMIEDLEKIKTKWESYKSVKDEQFQSDLASFRDGLLDFLNQYDIEKRYEEKINPTVVKYL